MAVSDQCMLQRTVKKDMKNNICQGLYGKINQVENSFFLPVAGAEKEAGRGKD